MNYDKSPNETEYLSADEQKLREMCRSLKKTDAPPDFDFKLKARIASAKPSDFKPKFGFALRYGIPALAVILVLGLLAMSGTFFSSGNNSMVADSAVTPQNPATPQTEAVSNFVPPVAPQPEGAAAVSNTNVAKTPEKSQSQIAGVQNAKRDLRKVKKDSDGGGSTVFSLTKDTPRQLDLNSNSNVSVPKPQNTDQANQMPVKEVLSRIGVNADLANGKWKVKSVSANSLGESSNIKENDVIESIDNQPLSTETIKGNSSGIKTLTITRKGEKLQIPLRGKQ